MMTALLLQLAGVAAEHIADDYLISVVAMNDYADSEEPRLEAAALQEWCAEVRAHLLVSWSTGTAHDSWNKMAFPHWNCKD